MSKRAPVPAYLEHFPCMQAPCVRHAAMMIEQAAYEGEGGVGLIVPDELFPSVSQPQNAYRDTFGNVHLGRWRLRISQGFALALNGHGVDHICEGAGLTANERDVVLLRAGGRSYGDVAQAFIDAGTPISRQAARVYDVRGRQKLVFTYNAIGRGE